MIPLKTAIKSTLIIDQDEYNNNVLKSIFREKGLSLDTVSEKIDYIEMIENNRYDCIIIDSDLPNNQTAISIDEIKGNYPWMIVVVLLKDMNYEKIIKYVRLGADDFIMKPFSWDDIEVLLKHYYY